MLLYHYGDFFKPLGVWHICWPNVLRTKPSNYNLLILLVISALCAIVPGLVRMTVGLYGSDIENMLRLAMVAIKALGWWVAYLDQDIFCLSPIGGILCFKILTSLKKLVLANDFKAHQHRLWGWQGRARTWDTWVISPFLGWYWTRYPCSASPKQRMTIVCPLCAQSLLLLWMFVEHVVTVFSQRSATSLIACPQCRVFPGWFRWRFALFFRHPGTVRLDSADFRGAGGLVLLHGAPESLPWCHFSGETRKRQTWGVYPLVN